MINAKEMTMLETIYNSEFHNGAENKANNPVWFENPFRSARLCERICKTLEKKGFARFVGEGRKRVSVITESGVLVVKNVKQSKKVSKMVKIETKMQSVNQAALEFLIDLRSKAEIDGIRATKAVSLMIDKFPTLTRKEAYYTAEAAGINILTARNTFDKIKYG